MLDQLLGFRSGDQCVSVHLNLKSTERYGSQQVLQGLPPAPALDERAAGGDLVIRQSAFKIQVELHAGHLQHVSQNGFTLETRRFHPLGFEEGGALLNDIQHGHPESIAGLRQMDRRLGGVEVENRGAGRREIVDRRWKLGPCSDGPSQQFDGVSRLLERALNSPLRGAGWIPKFAA